MKRRLWFGIVFLLVLLALVAYARHRERLNQKPAAPSVAAGRVVQGRYNVGEPPRMDVDLQGIDSQQPERIVNTVRFGYRGEGLSCLAQAKTHILFNDN